MKKLLVAIAFAATFPACHYGTGEAQKTLEMNQEYKGDKAGFSVNRANVTASESNVAAPADTAVADTSAKK